MKANELRIGNNVQYKGRPIRIESLIKDEFWTINRGDSIETIRLSDIEPISLTPEILEKCGFFSNRHSIDDSIYESTHLSSELRVQFGELKIIKDKTLKVTYKWETIAHIKSLHQLQNLYFALTGEELEVKL